MVLHLLQTQGQKRTLDECKQSAKQTVEVPMSVDNIEIQIELFLAAIQIFLTGDSLAYRAMRSL
eukprot:13671028-Ditylum_brightwellii.AAC.2